jgi:hypothetical protein
MVMCCLSGGALHAHKYISHICVFSAALGGFLFFGSEFS